MQVQRAQVNESLLQSIVTQPWQNNYVYALNFSVLELVRNLVLQKACRVLVTAAPTTISPPSTAPMLSAPTLIPSINGKP